MRHVVSIGGGIASTLLAAISVAWKHGQPNTILLNAVLSNEHPDTWRLCDAAERLTGVKMTYIAEDKSNGQGWRYVARTTLDDPENGALLAPFDVFFRERFLGNSRIDPCSKNLKREVLRKYMQSQYEPGQAILYVGIGASEWDRLPSIQERWAANGFEVRAPLTDWLGLGKMQAMEICQRLTGFVPALYSAGFPHNNCGGACIKAGQREWLRLLVYFPDEFAAWELAENIFRARFGDYTILRDRTDGVSKPLPLTTLRKRFERKVDSVLPGMAEHVLKKYPTLPVCAMCKSA